MDLETVSGILKTFQLLTEAPEDYLSGKDDAVPEIRNLTKKLYDYNKNHESSSKGNLQVLDELVIENLDDEQIWQQIELRNSFMCREYVADISHFLAKKNTIFSTDNVDKAQNESSLSKENESFDDQNDEDESNDEEFDNDGDDQQDEEDLDLGDEDEEENNYEKDLDDDDGDEDDDDDDNDNESENETHEGKKDKSYNRKKPSIVDDKFFKLSEMERFLEKEENKKDNESDDEDEDFIDYFENISSDSDNEKEGPHYNEFFDQPDDGSGKKKRKKSEGNSDLIESGPKKKKKVKFELDHDSDSDNSAFDFDNVEDGEESDDAEDEEEQRKKKMNESISTFEARQERLKSRIKALEEEALKEKPWQLKGEVTASSRPQNSLLEEYVEFDTAVRPPPVLTEKSTLKLEDIIKQRIKDKAWDDVERKIKPVEDPREYKKRLVLDQEKSKLSLAQIYEQEYLKQKEAKTEKLDDKPEEVPKEQLEIEKSMKSLFAKLDALSNFHFTPKMVSADVKIVSNLPAITVEEVAPVGVSDATLLAPEEIKPRAKGDLIGKTERTKTDKKRERRLKKKKQKLKQMEMERREKIKSIKENKEKLKDFSKKSNKTSKKLVKKFGRNVSYLHETGDGKEIRSSNAFFNKLQDEAKSLVKKKSHESKNFMKQNKLDVKKLKL